MLVGTVTRQGVTPGLDSRANYWSTAVVKNEVKSSWLSVVMQRCRLHGSKSI